MGETLRQKDRNPAVVLREFGDIRQEEESLNAIGEKGSFGISSEIPLSFYLRDYS